MHIEVIVCNISVVFLDSVVTYCYLAVLLADCCTLPVYCINVIHK